MVSIACGNKPYESHRRRPHEHECDLALASLPKQSFEVCVHIASRGTRSGLCGATRISTAQSLFTEARCRINDAVPSPAVGFFE